MSFARAKTVLTHATGEVELQVPHDGEGTVEPVCRCRLNTDPCCRGLIPVNVATVVSSERQTSGCVGSAGDGSCPVQAVVPRSGSRAWLR